MSGAMDESPPCYILQVDEFRFLLDCGWNEKFDPDFMKELRRHANQIDAVLLSYPDPLHLGALPYMVGKCGLSCPIYATIPVYKMGQMFMYDLFQSWHNNSEFSLFTLDDVDAAFDKIVQLKYNQSVSMKGKGFGLTITPLPAGHMIGGTIWKIVKIGEEDIIYATDFNHKKERHLNGCELEKLQRPSLFITDAFNATYQQARRRTRDEKLMTNILQTLRNNGNVLVAVDTAGRVLELAHMLDQLWRNKESGLIAYSLALLNNVSYNVVEFAKSQIEWMSDKLMRSFEGARNNPFQFKHLQLCHSISELNKVPSPKVVLASTPDMECGFSRELFLQWCSSPHNSIIVTSRTSPGTLARELIDHGTGCTLQLEVQRRVRLEGSELDEYYRQERAMKVTSKKRKSVDPDLSSDSEDELESAVSKGKHDLLVKSEVKTHPGFFKSSKKQFPLFPFFEDKIKYDEYGELIRPEDYKLVDAVTEMENGRGNITLKDLDMTDPPEEVPTKCITSTVTVKVAAQVQFIDFEGRSDGESLQKILSQLRPRRLILIRGTPDSTRAMMQHCQQWTDARIFAPSLGEIIDVTTETHIYQVRLTDALVTSLDLKKGKDAELAWLDAQIVTRNVTRDAKRLSIDGGAEEEKDTSLKDDMEEEIFTLEPVPMNEVEGHKTVLVNELKLSDFKQFLLKHNVPSEFSGGVLWCFNNTIAVRKVEEGHVTLEGCVSDEYYIVRDLLYEQYAIL